MITKPNPTAKIKLLTYEKGERSTRIKLEDNSVHFLPNTTITGWNPATKILEVEYWILNKKSIPYKL